MSVGLMRGNTERAQARIADLKRLSDAIQADSEADQRRARQLCKACYYFTGLGGAAITTQPCMSCQVDQTYGSTNTDALCMPCAQAGSLCKHCGADVDLKARRQKWPTALREPT